MKPFNFRRRLIQEVLIIFIFLIPSLQVNAQLNEIEGKKSLGDLAPELKISEWLKGKAIDSLKRGTIYIIDFWAPYCKPCIDAMPLHSKLAKKYKENVVFMGIYVYPHKYFSLERTKVFIDSLGKKVRYPLAVQKDKDMEVEWLEAFDAEGIPNTFIIDKEGKIAWIGYPTELPQVLAKVIDNTWDINKANTKRLYEKSMDDMDYEADLQLIEFRQNGYQCDFYGQPDSALHIIDEIVKKNPELKYAHRIAFNTFSALLKTDMKQAYDYAKNATSPTNPMGPAYFAVIGGIKTYTDKLSITPEIFRLGADAMKAYSEESPKTFMTIAEWYWRAGDKPKAIQYQKKATKAMKKTKVYGMGWFF